MPTFSFPIMPNRYETHLTLANAEQGVLESARQWAEAQGMKWTQIVLDAGKTPLQPMITLWGTESAVQQRPQIDSVVHAIAQFGGFVVRVKIEADLENDDVPQADAEANLSVANYFEHHIKVLVTDSAKLVELRSLAARHQARLSQNARRVRADGNLERFVTQRVHGCGRTTAALHLDRLLQEFAQHAVEVLEVEAEYVLYDSNLKIDADWF